MMPARLHSPTVGLMPTTPLIDDGHMIDPPVSVPMVSATRLAEAARPGSGARAAGIAVERVRVAALAAARAPAAGGLHPAPVGPLAHVGLGQQHRAGGAQLLRHERVLRRDRALERQRAGGRRHPIVRVEVVLQRDRDAVQRSAHLAGLALRVELVGDGQRVGVGLDDGPQFGPALVQRLDPRQVQLGDAACGAAGRIASLPAGGRSSPRAARMPRCRSPPPVAQQAAVPAGVPGVAAGPQPAWATASPALPKATVPMNCRRCMRG